MQHKHLGTLAKISNFTKERFMTFMKSIIGFVLLSTCSISQAQIYVPLDPSASSENGNPKASNKDLIIEHLGMHSAYTTNKSLLAVPAGKPAAFSECVPAPNLNDISGILEASRTTLSGSQAYKLGIVAGNVDVAANQMVVVQDYSRVKECLANDGQTRLMYGQAIRTVISISNFDAKANLTLPAIAATATIGGKSNSVQIKILGFSNPRMQALVGGISGKELNVESYGEFAKIHGELIALSADAGTTQSLERIGIVAGEDSDWIKGDVVTAFALQQIKDGRSCNDARARYKNSNNPSAEEINRTYGLIVGACSSAPPNNQQKNKASDYLEGLQVKY